MNGTQDTRNGGRTRIHPHARRSGAGRTSVLVVALDTVTPAVAADADVLVVAPALNTRLRRWLSDEDSARRRAQARAVVLVDRLERAGVRAEGRIGDADPLQAIADALRSFRADEIVIAARSEHSADLADALVSASRERFALPTFRTAPHLEAAAEREAA